MASTPSADLYDRATDILTKCTEDLLNLAHSLPFNGSSPNDSPAGSAEPVSSEAPPPPPPAAPPVSDEVRVSPAPSGSTTSSAPSSSTSCTSMTDILKKFNGKLIDGRLYCSLDKKRLVLAQLVSLEKPMGDEEAKQFERDLNSIDTDFYLTDAARTAPKGYTITRL